METWVPSMGPGGELLQGQLKGKRRDTGPVTVCAEHLLCARPWAGSRDSLGRCQPPWSGRNLAASLRKASARGGLGEPSRRWEEPCRWRAGTECWRPVGAVTLRGGGGGCLLSDGCVMFHCVHATHLP